MRLPVGCLMFPCPSLAKYHHNCANLNASTPYAQMLTCAHKWRHILIAWYIEFMMRGPTVLSLLCILVAALYRWIAPLSFRCDWLNLGLLVVHSLALIAVNNMGWPPFCRSTWAARLHESASMSPHFVPPPT